MSDAPAILDREHLHRYTAGDAALEAELFALLDAQIEACIARLEAAMDDAGEWRAAAHTLKGAARGVGANALGEAAAALEGAEPDPALLAPLKAAADKTREAMVAARAA